MLLGYSLKPRPNSRALGMAGSVMTIGLSINGGSYSKNQFDEGKRDSLVQKFGLRRLLLLDQEDNKRMLCLRGVKKNPVWRERKQDLLVQKLRAATTSKTRVSFSFLFFSSIEKKTKGGFSPTMARWWKRETATEVVIYFFFAGSDCFRW